MLTLLSLSYYYKDSFNLISIILKTMFLLVALFIKHLFSFNMKAYSHRNHKIVFLTSNFHGKQIFI